MHTRGRLCPTPVLFRRVVLLLLLHHPENELLGLLDLLIRQRVFDGGPGDTMRDGSNRSCWGFASIETHGFDNFS
jgi:hypothetical protein